MSEAITRIAWLLLLLIHVKPASAAISPTALRLMYGLESGGPMAVLMTHRAVLFIAICALCALAVFSPAARQGASLAVGISMAGFLIVYAGAGAPVGALRTIAAVDAAGLIPLGWVALSAWRP